VDDDVGRPQDLEGLDRQEIRIAGAGADQPHGPGRGLVAAPRTTRRRAALILERSEVMGFRLKEL